MQSTNINSIVTLTEVFESIFNELRQTADAAVADISGGVITLTGDFFEVHVQRKPREQLRKTAICKQKRRGKTDRALRAHEPHDRNGAAKIRLDRACRVGRADGNRGRPFLFRGYGAERAPVTEKPARSHVAQPERADRGQFGNGAGGSTHSITAYSSCSPISRRTLSAVTARTSAGRTAL